MVKNLVMFLSVEVLLVDFLVPVCVYVCYQELIKKLLNSEV